MIPFILQYWNDKTLEMERRLVVAGKEGMMGGECVWLLNGNIMHPCDGNGLYFDYVIVDI